MLRTFNNRLILTAGLIFILFAGSVMAELSDDSLKTKTGFPVILDADTLFNIYNGIGTFTAAKRAEEIGLKLDELVEEDVLNFDSVKTEQQNDYWLLTYSGTTIMAVTPADAKSADMKISDLVQSYRKIIINKLETTRILYSQKSLIEKGLFTVLYLILLAAFFWLSTKVFPWIYKKVESFEGKQVKSVSVKGKEIVRSTSIVSLLIVLLQGLRLALSLYAIYLFITEIISLWPYTRKWDIEPILKGIVLFIFYTIVFLFVGKGVGVFIKYMFHKYDTWKGTQIKSVKIKSVELLSADRTVEILKLTTRVFRFALFLIVFYLYITISFSLFTFSENWADTLLDYVLKPLNSVFLSIINFLPNLFFIIVLIFVFRYLLRFIKFIFAEVEAGNLTLPGFHVDWAMPTYKIVRFLVLILAVIIIFPYLPGSDSPFFQGVSVFVGILFSLGSTSAIANIVAGVVITYMRPFKIGDRVRIAETTGDVIEKTLLVTRVRTTKNVDITIPNAMVLGSHIINFSSSADEKGLILHTTVTIGYDVPWKKIHELLISAAGETEHVLSEPKPFVLQTSLDDFYVSYELNAYTNNPGMMARIYSELHSNIQDKFNEAGVEIMSPHYSAVRDGNQTTIPEDYLPKGYKAPSFRLFGVNIFGNKEDNK